MGNHNPYVPAVQYFSRELQRWNRNWMEKARCALPQYRDYEWFPPRNKMSINQRLAHRRQLQKVCNACPVQAECRNFAKTSGVTAGIWAGKYYGS